MPYTGDNVRATGGSPYYIYLLHKNYTSWGRLVLQKQLAHYKAI